LVLFDLLARIKEIEGRKLTPTYGNSAVQFINVHRAYLALLSSGVNLAFPARRRWKVVFVPGEADSGFRVPVISFSGGALLRNACRCGESGDDCAAYGRVNGVRNYANCDKHNHPQRRNRRFSPGREPFALPMLPSMFFCFGSLIPTCLDHTVRVSAACGLNR
jgi:hypothetical protein